MLAVKAYDKAYINGCEARMREQLAAYDALGTKAKSAAVAAFERSLFAHLTLVLDSYFAHRTRGLEGKDGNPINEVRMLCDSLLNGGGVLAANKTIKYKAETSVLKLALGDEIRIDRSQFGALCDGYFGEIRRRFS